MAKIIAIAVTIGAVIGLDVIGMNRIAAAVIGAAAGVAVLALLRLTSLGNRQRDLAVDQDAGGKPVSKKAAAKRSKGH